MTFDVWKQSKLQNGLEKLKTVPLPNQVIDSLEDMKKLAGLMPATDDLGSNISYTGTEKGELMKKHNIRPGTPEWFRLWFTLPYLTGAKPVKD
jgi:hypothetical protein